MSKSGVAMIVTVSVSLFVSLAIHFYYSGAYVFGTQTNRYTYWIDPVSTTVPIAGWAIATLCFALSKRSTPKQIAASFSGYTCGWVGTAGFCFWIVSLPKAPMASTMGIAVALTPFFFFFVFSLLYLVGYIATTTLLQKKEAPSVNRTNDNDR